MIITQNNINILPYEIQELIVEQILKTSMPLEVDYVLNFIENNRYVSASKQNALKLLNALKRLIELSSFNNEMVRYTIKSLFPLISTKDLNYYSVKDIVMLFQVNILSENNSVLNLLYRLVDGFKYIFVTYQIENNSEKIVCINYSSYNKNMRWSVEMVTKNNDKIQTYILKKNMYRCDFHEENEFRNDNTMNLMMNMYDLLFNVVPEELNIKGEFYIKNVDMYSEPNYEYRNMFEQIVYKEDDVNEEYFKLKQDEWITVKSIYKLQ